MIKMKMKLFKTVLIFAIPLALLFAACTVGLGSAVDTGAPTVEVSYPPKNSVIRQSFVVSGSCADDLAISYVDVTVTNSSTREVYGPYRATLNRDKSQWSVQLNRNNNQDYSTYEAYKQWEFPDGNYIVTAKSVDGKNNPSPEASIPVSIDNTAPVLLVSKPLAYGTETASIYGRTLNIIGDISEEHETSKLVLYYKEQLDSSGTLDSETKTLEISGFGTMSSDNPLVIAKLDSTSQQTQSTTLDHNYRVIYGSQSIDLNTADKKNFYCGFMLEDNAKTYQNPGDSGVAGGNQSTEYYILSDNFNDELFSEEKYSLNARNLMLLLSGKSNYSSSEIETITSKLEEAGNSAKSTDITAAASSKFSIDPKNNPVWSVTNYDNANGQFKTYETGSSVPFVLEAGGDGIPIDTDTISIKLYHLGATYGPRTDTTPNKVLISAGEYQDGLLKTRLDNYNTLFPTDTLQVNHYYELVVEGEDENHNQLASKDGLRYGFKLYSSYAPPSISFTTGSGGFVENNYYQGKSVNDNDIVVYGQITTAAQTIVIPNVVGQSTLDKSKVKVSGMTVTSLTDGSPISVNTNDAQIKYKYVINELTQTSAGSSTEGRTYTFKATITKKTDSDKLIPDVPGAYKYKIGFVAEDSLNAYNDPVEFEFKLDSKAPQLTDEPVITPLVRKDDKDCVNGTITISGNLTDEGAGAEKLYYQIGDSPVQAIPNTTTTSLGYHWSFDINTLTAPGFTNNTDLTLKIYAKDAVLNDGGSETNNPSDFPKYFVTKQIRVDQSTDKPVITPANSDTIFTKTNNILNFTVTDDDGLKFIRYRTQKTAPSPGDWSEPTRIPENTTESLNTASYSLNIPLPDEEGEYTVEVYAEDIKGLSTGHDTKEFNNIKKDYGAPEFKITTSYTADTWLKASTAGAVTISGSVKDGSGEILKIERKIDNGEFAELASSGATPAITITGSIVSGATWTDSSIPALANGQHTIKYRATDKYDQTTEEKSVTFSVDNIAPTVRDDVTFGEIATNGWYNKSFGDFTVTVADEGGSGIKAVYYQKAGTTTWAGMSENADHTWSANIAFSDSEAKTLSFKAEDNAGNETTTPVSRTYKIDTTIPELTLTGLSGEVYVNKKSDKSLTANFKDLNGSGVKLLKIEIVKQTETGTETVYTATENLTTDELAASKTAAGGQKTITIPAASLVEGQLKVTATDTAGNTVQKSACNFIVDTAAPVIQTPDITKVYKEADKKYFVNNVTAAAFTISGTIVDDKFAGATLTITEQGVSSGAHTITKNITSSSWSFNDIDLSSWTSGTSAKCVITASDEAGNSTADLNAAGQNSNYEFDIIFDRAVPGISSEEVSAGYKFRNVIADVKKDNKIFLGGRYSEHTFGRLNSIQVTVYPTDVGSGISKLEYRLSETDQSSNFDSNSVTWSSQGVFRIDRTENPIKAETTISGFKSTSVENPNFLLLRPVDNCGNKGTIKVLKVHVDQTAPTVLATATKQLTNGTKIIELEGGVYDEDAGLKALRIKINNGESAVLTLDSDASTENSEGYIEVSNDTYGSFSYKGYAPADPKNVADSYFTTNPATYKLGEAPSYIKWKLKLKTNNLEDGDIIQLEAEDWAEYEGKGNIAPNPGKLAVIEKDTTPPEVEIKTPAPGIDDAHPTSINGKNTIKGISSDVGSSPEKLELYISKDVDKPSELSGYRKLSEISTVGANAVNVSKLYKYEFADVDFYDPQLILTDEADKEVWLLVLATDKAGNKSSVTNAVKYKIDRNTDRPKLTITNDDVNLAGMSSINPKLLKDEQFYINVYDDDGLTATNAQESDLQVWYKTSKDNVGYRRITPLNSGSGNFTLSADGAQTLEFKVVDIFGNEYESGATNSWEKIKLYDSQNPKHEFVDDPKLYMILDLSSPEVSIEGMKKNTETSWSTVADFERDVTVVGGATRKLIFKVKASDDGSGIKENGVTVSATLNNTAITGTSVTEINGETDFYEVAVPCTVVDEGILSIEIKAEDKAGRISIIEKQYDFDNNKPEIEIESPEENSEQYGTITVQGFTSERVKLSYAVSPVKLFDSETNELISPEDYTDETEFSFIKNGTTPVTLPTKDKHNAAIDPSEALEDLCSFVPYSANSTDTLTTFYIYFDGQTTTGNNHTELLNTWLKNIGITTNTDLTSRIPAECFDDIVTLYLYLKAEDTAGNVTITPFTLLVDPQGNRPKLEYSYPTEDGLTLGGTINLLGSVTGNSDSYTVYMQVEKRNSDGEWNLVDLRAKGYTTVTGEDTKAIIDVDGTTWSQRFNESDEFNPTDDDEDGLSHLRVKLYAEDPDGTPSSIKIREFVIDNKMPVIDQTLTLVQFNSGFDSNTAFTVDSTSGAITYATGALKASREYKDDMSVSGKWYLVGKVTDESGLRIINTDGTKDSEGYTNLAGSGAAADGSIVKAFNTSTETGCSSYVFCLAVGSAADNAVGVSTLKFYAKDGGDVASGKGKVKERQFTVKYDNMKPVVTSLGSDIDILNENGFYTFGSDAYENGISSGTQTVNQTGVERVAFYFTRALTNGTPSIFDPMIRSGRAGNLQAYESLAYEDGLYWITADIKANGVNQATITLQNNKPVNVHKGGLAKVNGTIYRIKNITSEEKIELSGNPGNATTVKFAIANVIDNTIPEELSRNNVETEKVENYGYGYPKGIYDDGDLMPEKFKTVGTKTTWEATINSKNISDGPVVLHYVVFDKAGNFTETTSTAMVQNNSPRIAGALIGTDEDGDGEVNNTDEYSEFISYSNIFENGYSGGIKATDVTIPKKSTDAAPVRALVMKRKTVIKPEVVGGNGKIGYTWSVSARNTNNNGWADAYYNSGSTPVDLGTGTGDNEDETSRMEYLTGVEGIVLTEADILGKNIADGENQKFTFTLWDSTSGLTYGTNTQKAKMNVIMDVVVRDGVAAKNKIIPFYWNSTENNSLADNSTAKGHIELPQDYNTASPDGIPKISGAIKLEGIAQDNSLLKSLSVNFNNGSDNDYEIAKYYTEDEEGNKTYGSWTTNSGTGWSAEIRKATYAELLAAGYIDDLPEDVEDETEDVPYSSQAYGHIVHWTMNIDTETMLKKNSTTDKLFAPKTGIVITVSALDKGTPTYSNGAITAYTSKPFANNGDATVAQTGGNNGAGRHTCKYTVDLVPYIRGIKTALSKKSKKNDTSEYDRTARGHYPVASTETIYLYGFNLAGGTLYDSAATPHSVMLGAANTTKYTGKTVYPIVIQNADETYDDANLSEFISGPVYVKVGDVQSLNNSNNNNSQGAYGAELPTVDTYGDDDTYTTFSNFYNRMPNEQNNFTLTDDVELDVWKINSEAAIPTYGGRVDEPVMKINPRTNNVGFAFLDGPKDFSRPNNMNNSYKTAGRYNSQHDARTTAALAYDWDGNVYSLNAGGNEGDPVNFEKHTAGKGTASNVYIEYVCQNKKRDGSGAYMDLRYKIRSPNIVTTKNGTNATNIYMVYYDSYNDEIRYKYGTAAGSDLFVEASKDYSSYNAQVIATDKDNNLPTASNKKYIGNPLGGAGEFVDIAVIPKGTTVNGSELADDVAVVVWYDAAAKTLKYSYNESPRDYSWRNATTNDTAYRGLNRSNWEDATPIFSGAGEFCQVKVDGNGGVHIAAFDPVSGDLRYAYLSTYKSTSSITTYLVDTAGNVGSHMRMDVGLKDGNPVPYISYIGSNMPKLAVLKTTAAAAGAINDMYTGNWEISYIPTTSDMEDLDYKKLMTNVDNRINVGVWKTDAGVIRDSKRKDNTNETEYIGTSSVAAGDGTFWGNGTENPVVAYSVLKDTANSRIEAAQMQ